MSGGNPGDPVVLFEQLYQQERTAVVEAQKAALNAVLADWLLRIRHKIDDELRALGHHHHRPRYLLLLQPTFRTLSTGEPVVTDVSLPLNQSYTAVITLFNPTTGASDPVSPSDVFTATPSDTTNMSATVAPFVPPANATAAQTALAGIPAVTVQWLHNVTPPLVGITVSISDSAGNTAFVDSFDMAPAVTTPDQIGVDSGDAVFTTIPTPV